MNSDWLANDVTYENLPKSAPCSTIVSAISKYSIFSAFQSGGFDFESRDSLSAPRTHKISTTLPRLFLTANEIGDSFDADARFGSAFYGLNSLCHISYVTMSHKNDGTNDVTTINYPSLIIEQKQSRRFRFAFYSMNEK